MSQFSDTLRALMDLEDSTLDQVQLADRTGISQSTISRLMAGREPTLEQVGKICAVISTDRDRRIELLLADLRDRAQAGKIAGIDERHFIIAPVSDAPSTPGSLMADLQLIESECLKHEDIRGMVTELAKMITRHEAELIDAENARNWERRKRENP